MILDTSLRRLAVCWFSLGLFALGPLAPGALATPGDDSRAASSATAGSPVVATWKPHGEVTQADLDRWIAYERSAASAEAEEISSESQAAPDSELSDDERTAALRRLAFIESFAAEAERDGLADSRSSQLRLERARQRLLVPRLRRQLEAQITVSDAEIDELLRQNPDAFHRPKKLKLRNLYKKLGDDPDVVRGQMDRIHQRLVAGADFAELAEQESESQTGPRGGMMGFVDPQELPAALAGPVARLAPGEISRPLEYGGGLTIFQCEEVREAKAPSAAEQRQILRRQLLRQKHRQAWSDFQAKLLEEAKPRLDPASEGIVLELPDYRLTASDLDLIAQLRAAGTGAKLGSPQRRALLDEWTSAVLATRQADELGLGHDPEVVETLHWRRLEILAEAAMARSYTAEIGEPSEAELRRYFDAHRARYRELPAYDLEVLHFGKAEDDPKLLARAEEVSRRLADGSLDFATAARRDSIDPSAAAGGAVGWTSKRQIALLGPTVSRSIEALEPGERTPLLHLDTGLWIFGLKGLREARELGFEEVEGKVRDDWYRSRIAQNGSDLLDRRLREIGFEVAPTTSAPPRVVRWSTASEFECYGYHVYRGESPDGPFERMTAKPIACAGTSDVPQSYRFEDASATPGKVYYYYVEALSTSGERKRLTPIGESRGEPVATKDEG
ncbi:MAG: peptidyl-prolyl cis-trans isomerase [Acidobacteria bacterium]|nr:peptidyl-prolyl cis-trans isomerase [Acidobacteriota bacterium]